MNETIANRPITSLDELEDTLSARCRALSERERHVKAATNFHWWPQAA
jgi:hypothetical protein